MAIQTNQVTYTSGSTTIKTSFVLTWIEEQNQAGNYTDLTLIVTTSQTPTGSGYKRTLRPSGTYAIVNGVQTNLISADKSVYNGLEVKRFTQRIEHNNDGTKAISASLRCNVGGDICTGSGTITLTPINRINQMSVTPATLTNQDATITITKYVSSYTTTIEYTIAGGTYTLADKASGTSFTLAYDDLKALIGVFTSDDIYIKATTYDGANAIGYVDTTITIQTGQIAFSLYDDREGNVGATFGEEATSEGLNVFLNAVFGKASKRITADFNNADVLGVYEELTGNNYVGRKWANGFLEYFIVKDIPAGSYTAWQSHYYRDVNANITFPVPFVTALGTLAQYNNPTAYASQPYVTNKTGTQKVRLMAFTNQSSLTGTLYMYIWGYWK